MEWAQITHGALFVQNVIDFGYDTFLPFNAVVSQVFSYLLDVGWVFSRVGSAVLIKVVPHIHETGHLAMFDSQFVVPVG